MIHAKCTLEYVCTRVPSPLGQYQYIYAIAYLIFIANLNDGTEEKNKIDSTKHTYRYAKKQPFESMSTLLSNVNCT